MVLCGWNGGIRSTCGYWYGVHCWGIVHSAVASLSNNDDDNESKNENTTNHTSHCASYNGRNVWLGSCVGSECVRTTICKPSKLDSSSSTSIGGVRSLDNNGNSMVAILQRATVKGLCKNTIVASDIWILVTIEIHGWGTIHLNAIIPTLGAVADESGNLLALERECDCCSSNRGDSCAIVAVADSALRGCSRPSTFWGVDYSRVPWIDISDNVTGVCSKINSTGRGGIVVCDDVRGDGA